MAGGAARYCDGIRTRVLIMLLTTAVLPAGTAADVAASSRPAIPAAVAADAPVEVMLALRPRHPALLRRLAAASSARPPLPARTVRALFLPTPGQVAAVRAAMLSQGLRFQAQRALSLTFTGSAAAAGRAFGVTLQVARRADGSLARRPSAMPRAPASVAPLIQDIAGLDTTARLHPAGGSSGSAEPPPPCAGPGPPAAICRRSSARPGVRLLVPDRRRLGRLRRERRDGRVLELQPGRCGHLPGLLRHRGAGQHHDGRRRHRHAPRLG